MICCQAYAWFTKSSTTHIQKLRDGMAHVCVEQSRQRRTDIESALPPDYIVMLLSFDETTEDLQVESSLGPQSVLMAQAKLLFRFGDEVVEEDVVVQSDR